MRPRPATATLVKQDDAIDKRIKELPVIAFAPGTRATVNEYHRQPFRITAFLCMQTVSVGYSDFVCSIGFYGIEQFKHTIARGMT